MSPETSILTPDERDELEGTVLVRHRLEEQYRDLEQQHEAASLGMWIFLGTEVLFFGTLFLGLSAYRYQYGEAFEKASEKLNWIIGGINTLVLLVSSLTMVLAVHYAKVGRRNALVLCPTMCNSFLIPLAGWARMKTRKLGRTDLEVSEIGFGAREIGRPWGLPIEGDFVIPSERDAGALLDRVLDLGINFIDTAPAYMLSEERLGRLLRKFEGKQAVLYEVVARGTAEEYTSERRRQHHAYR